MGGFAPAIGILGEGELEGEGAQNTRDTGNELPGGRGNNGGFKEKAKGLELADASLCAVAATVTRGGVVKSSAVQGLRQGTTSGERGVTRISPSNPRPRGENSAGTLPKFKKRKTSEKGLLGS
jgi:hypothetical protein